MSDPRPALDLAEVTPDTFDSFVGTVFEVRTDGATPIGLTLASVTRYTPHADMPRAEPFALLFRALDTVALQQRIHRLTHADLGELDIFLVPVGPQPGGTLGYEAVFN